MLNVEKLSVWLFFIFEFAFILYGLICLFAAKIYYEVSEDRKLWLKKIKAEQTGGV